MAKFQKTLEQARRMDAIEKRIHDLVKDVNALKEDFGEPGLELKKKKK